MTSNNSPQPARAATSPCIGFCKLNADDMCHGCGRSLNQIQAWPIMTEQQRIEVTKECVRHRHSTTDT